MIQGFALRIPITFFPLPAQHAYDLSAKLLEHELESVILLQSSAREIHFFMVHSCIYLKGFQNDTKLK
ncbi:MAG: hypothetical protein Ct9H300mP28_29740 [Pseudomonadota bacterium]|nr:MAG: hypothetical protein Ct9H300mP28_29740 [Pseudomonadota bacterium]